MDQGPSVTATGQKAYEPQYWGDDDKWHRVPVTRSGNAGVPYPLLYGGVLATIDLFGWEQANAFAWAYAANCAADGKRVKTRVAEYDLTFDIRTTPAKA